MLNNKVASLTAVLAAVFLLSGCSDSRYKVEKITARHIEVSPGVPEDPRIAQFLEPYRDSLSAQLDQVISYSPEFLAKNDRNGTLGAWLSDLSIVQVGNYLAQKGIKEPIDVALFNAGGVRTSLPQGDLKRSFVYEIMPFENSYVLVKLKGEQMQEMFRYLADYVSRGTFHPLGGMCLTIQGGGSDLSAVIGGKKFDPRKEYNVLTTDFLLKGGDNMNFFAQNQGVIETGLKMRESIMDFLAVTDTITIPKDLRYEIK